ncbi:uncharacterized protein LOC131957725 [Physella acuta]|uniref:uncharacterized protein LOC131957725 n=1 Tax=Physella acuta TaxID=109671 RepID=UPI0027DE3ABB|nr:uncharacterized protein LOC131957725 [Physella acuta]XP_059178466.1 uncharacterized protein LOC131957725 [Physella acuta]XP_059178474.1 uncharacterized protein LOC131957725 [Physella acuta]XP_059178484.1 uncharacterized protein LOC131957725 [Physella acuta]XP_059178491.1 uncharacterized protein LOC131957725 [Physella acuta]
MAGQPFLPVYQSDNASPVELRLLEPPYSEAVCYSWGADVIDSWLVETGFGRYRAMFRQNGIDGRKLLTLDEAGLRRMGVFDSQDARQIVANISVMRHIHRHLESSELPGLPYTYYRALCFGKKSTLTSPLLQENMCYTTWSVPDQVTLRRINSLSGGEDTFGWFARNRPHPTI